MRTVVIDYEGNELTERTKDRATHVLVSRRRDGKLRVQATDQPITALVKAQKKGDRSTRMTQIEGDRATFTVVPDYDPLDTPQRAAAKRSRLVQLLVMAVLVIVIVCAAILVV